MSAPVRSRRADLILLLLTLYWGATFIVVKDALQFASPLVFVALRFAVGAAALSLIARRTLTDGPSVRSGLLLGVFLFLGFALQTAGLQWTTPSRSAFITGLCVVLVPAVSLVLFRRVPLITSWIGVAFAAVGLFALTGGAKPDVATWKGDLLSLACAMAFAIHITLTGHYAPRRKVTAMVTMQLWTVCGLSVAALPFVSHQLVWAPALWLPVLYTGILGSAAAISMQSWAQARTSAIRAGLIFSLEPVFAAIFSVSLGRERLGIWEYSGGSLVILGVLIAEVGGAWLEARRIPAPTVASF
jgi:drug/metabolite transporter (DMT)-like permease